jgi:P4 family phage/plasmid primase-like protien
MTTILDATVSVFASATAKTPLGTQPLGAALGAIQDGTFRKEIEDLRTILRQDGKRAYADAKKRLAALTFCGTFAPTRAKTNLGQHSGVVHADIDHVPAVLATKARLTGDSRVGYVFISPSGDGLKLGVLVPVVSNDSAYKRAWQAVADDFHQRYAVTFDPSGRDICRLCFVSWDPELYINAQPECFVIPPPDTPKTTRPGPVGGVEDDYARVASAVAAIHNVDSYDVWITLGMSLHSTGQPWARSLWDGWSCTSSKFDAQVQEAKWQSFHADGKVTIGTLFYLAKEAGWQGPPLSSLNVKRQTPRPVPMMGSAVPRQDTPNAGARPLVGGPTANGEPAVDVALPWSDTLNAVHFVRDHGASLHYCFPWKSWLVWNGRFWERDTSGQVMRLAKLTIKRLAQHAATIEDDDKMKALLAHVKKSLSTAALEAMVRNAQSEDGVPVQPEALDATMWLLNVQNGTLDLQDGVLRPHLQADMLTKGLAIPYALDAVCPLWEQFLWRIMGGSLAPDTPEMSAAELEARHTADERARALIAFLQRAIGYALTGSTREQCLFILHGITKTGKSTFLAILRALFGPYGQQADMQSFMHKDRQEVRNDLADLAGSRFVCALEAQEGQRLAESLVKQLTGGADLLKARFLFQEYFTFKPQFKIFLGTNHKPVIKETDAAIWERIRLVPFTVQIPKEQRDKTLEEKLHQELPGILAWAVRGCLEWQRLGDLCAPEAVIHATATYREESDAFGRFISECCLVSPQVKVKASELYDAYKRWCEASGEEDMKSTKFGNRLEEQGFGKEKKGIVWRKGITLL